MVLIHDRILKIDIYNFEMSQITPEKSLKSNQIYSVQQLQPPLPGGSAELGSELGVGGQQLSLQLQQPGVGGGHLLGHPPHSLLQLLGRAASGHLAHLLSREYLLSCQLTYFHTSETLFITSQTSVECMTFWQDSHLQSAS